MSITIMLIEDDATIRDGIAYLIDNTEGFSVTGQYASFNEAAGHLESAFGRAQFGVEDAAVADHAHGDPGEHAGDHLAGGGVRGVRAAPAGEERARVGVVMHVDAARGGMLQSRATK